MTTIFILKNKIIKNNSFSRGKTNTSEKLKDALKGYENWDFTMHYDRWDVPSSSHRTQMHVQGTGIELMQKYGDFKQTRWYTDGNKTASIWADATKPDYMYAVAVNLESYCKDVGKGCSDGLYDDLSFMQGYKDAIAAMRTKQNHEQLGVDNCKR